MRRACFFWICVAVFSHWTLVRAQVTSDDAMVTFSPTPTPTTMLTSSPTPTTMLTAFPTIWPTLEPTGTTEFATPRPSRPPTRRPTQRGTQVPTGAQTINDDNTPVSPPTPAPSTVTPTASSNATTTTAPPTRSPTAGTRIPTAGTQLPTSGTARPSSRSGNSTGSAPSLPAPTQPSAQPSRSGNSAGSTPSPPVSAPPIILPTHRPTSVSPTPVPMALPTRRPTQTAPPTANPTSRAPSAQPSSLPTNPPTPRPTTSRPTFRPTQAPTPTPTTSPTPAPSPLPTIWPTPNPSPAPTSVLNSLTGGDANGVGGQQTTIIGAGAAVAVVAILAGICFYCRNRRKSEEPEFIGEEHYEEGEEPYSEASMSHRGSGESRVSVDVGNMDAVYQKQRGQPQPQQQQQQQQQQQHYPDFKPYMASGLQIETTNSSIRGGSVRMPPPQRRGSAAVSNPLTADHRVGAGAGRRGSVTPGVNLASQAHQPQQVGTWAPGMRFSFAPGIVRDPNAPGVIRDGDNASVTGSAIGGASIRSLRALGQPEPLVSMASNAMAARRISLVPPAPPHVAAAGGGGTPKSPSSPKSRSHSPNHNL